VCSPAGSPRHLHPHEVAQEGELDGGTVVKDSPPRLSPAKVDQFSCESKRKLGRLSLHLPRGLGGGVPINIVLTVSDFPQDRNLDPNCHPCRRHTGARPSKQNRTCRELRGAAPCLFDLPSVVMRGDRGEVRCCSLSKVWNGGDGWNPSGDVVCHARIC
jgi:hypothetical protein